MIETGDERKSRHESPFSAPQLEHNPFVGGEVSVFQSDLLTTDTGPATYVESNYSYLARSGRVEAGEVRGLIERCFASYPKRHRKDLLPRLRSNEDQHFFAAFFELYIFHILTRLGYRVTVHPSVGRSTSRRPDFSAKDTSESLLVECTLASGASTGDIAAIKRLNQAYDALNKLSSPDYFIWLRITGVPKTPIPGRAFREFAKQFLDSLVFSEVAIALAASGLEDLPTANFVHDGCTIALSPIPKSESSRGKQGLRPIGVMGSGEAQWIDARTPVRNAIKAKASRYGKLRRPYVIAVNAIDHRLEKIDIMEALFGKETFIFGPDSTKEPRMDRQRDGVFFGPGGPINRRVSAIIIVSELTPWTVSGHNPEVYVNPFAHFECPPSLLRLSSHRPVAGHLEHVDGMDAKSIFELSSEWPMQRTPA